MSRSAAEVLVRQLARYGIARVYGVPGESYLAVLDALYDSGIEFISCRNEGGAAFMAEAAGKLTNRPGVCIVTRGPGASNATIGLHTARQDETPMILFVGQVGHDMLGREAFQEVDYRLLFAEEAKHVEQVDRAERLPEIVARAWTIAQSGRKGPVVVVLPEDLLATPITDPELPPPLLARPAPAAGQIAQLAKMLATAARPVMILGGAGWTDTARDQITAFAEANGLPVAAGFRCQDRIDNRHPNYIGELGTSATPQLKAMIREADLVLAVGERLGEMTTDGYSLLVSPDPAQRLIHVYPDPDQIGRVYHTALPIAAGPEEFAASVAGLAATSTAARQDWLHKGRADFEATRHVPALPGEIDFGVVMAQLRDSLPPEAILTNGAGNYTGWAHRFYLYRAPRTQLGPICGAMGYGVPAAVAACAEAPGRPVICFAGDGCFQMNGQELATAAQHGLAPIVLVFDNGMYGTIRMHQENHYPGRPSGTRLVNPDFAALGRAYGGLGFTVRRTEEFAPALAAALTAATQEARLSVIHLHVDPRIRTTTTTF